MKKAQFNNMMMSHWDSKTLKLDNVQNAYFNKGILVSFRVDSFGQVLVVDSKNPSYAYEYLGNDFFKED